jgi:sulfoxide reductase catalytic subunit YedY
MGILPPSDIPESNVTAEESYLNRRTFLRAGILVASVAATGWMYRKLSSPGTANTPSEPPPLADLVVPTTQPTTRSSTGLARSTAGFVASDKPTSFQNITHYNNFYEFSLDKEAVGDAASGFSTRPWQVTVSGLCRKPATFDLDELLRIAPPEQRIYRMRCVEAWSMVVPWNGYSLSELLSRVEPLSSAKYVAFQTLLDPKRMPNQNDSILEWPYVEGLRMDEAMHPLTMLASGIYGKQLPPQDGAPVRLVVPWKYGFKGIKSIVKIDLREEQPPTTWNIAAPNEYGFYANVNPNVDHPRWSQATERRIDDREHVIETQLFNGYAEEVGSLYRGMDLRVNF